MATVDLRVGGTAELPYVDSLGKAHVLVQEVDFAQTNRDSADVLQLFNIPANTLVLKVVAVVQTEEGGTATIDVGDADDADGYLDGFDADTAGAYANDLALTDGTPNTVTGYSAGKFYASAGVISATINNAMDAGKVSFHVLCFKMG